MQYFLLFYFAVSKKSKFENVLFFKKVRKHETFLRNESNLLIVEAKLRNRALELKCEGLVLDKNPKTNTEVFIKI